MRLAFVGMMLAVLTGCPSSDASQDARSKNGTQSQAASPASDIPLQLEPPPPADEDQARQRAAAAVDASAGVLPPQPTAPRVTRDSGRPGPAVDASMVPEWAYRVRQDVQTGSPPAPARHQPAVVPDRVYDDSDPVPIRRLVYRVRLHLPRSYGRAEASRTVHAGELSLDVSTDRLRARFLGDGWPVDRGAEVRLRGDANGVYVIDGSGGRPLDPGELGSWFEGRRRGRSQARVIVWREWGDGTDGPGELLCALLAEWARQPRDLLMRRCRHNALPPRFRIGLWLAELTAVVPMELPRNELRADHVDPPQGIEARSETRFLHAEEIARIAPLRATPAPPDGTLPALTVSNRGPTRLIVIVQGVPLGWIAPQATASYRALRPGYYRVGVIRPLGMPRYSPRTLELPTQLTVH